MSKKMPPHITSLPIANPSGDSRQSLPHSSIQHLSLSAIPEDYELTVNPEEEQDDQFAIEEDNIDEAHVVIRDPAPDGGYGWVIVLVSFCCNFITDGISYTFGIFFNEFLNHYDTTKAKVALVGSLMSAFYLGAGPLVSALVNYYGCRVVSISGSILAFFAFVLSVYAPTVEVLMLTYGVLGGIGFGLIYLPAIVSVGYYFNTKRALATGMAVCGSGAGAFLFAPLCQYLLSVYNWQNTMLILGAIILNCSVFGSMIRPLSVQAETIITEEPDHRRLGSKPLLQRIAEEKRRRLLSHSMSSNFLLLMQNQDPTSTNDIKARLIINTEPGVHSTLNLDQLFVTTPLPTATSTVPPLSPIQERKVVNSDAETVSDEATSSQETSQQDLKQHDIKDSEVDIQLQDSAISLSGECVYPSQSTLAQTPTPEISGSRFSGSGWSRNHRRGQNRTISECSQGSHLQVILTTTPSRRNSIRESQTIFVRPMYKKDIFYAGSTNLGASAQQMMESQRFDGTSMMTSVVSIPARDILDKVQRQLAAREAKETHDEEEEEKKKLTCCDKLVAIVTGRDEKEEVGMDKERGRFCPLRLPPSVKDILREMLDFSLVTKSRAFMMLSVANVFGMMGFYVPFIYLTQFALKCVKNGDQPMSEQNAALLISVIGITNTFGRLMFGWISDKISMVKIFDRRLNALFINNVCIAGCGVTIMILPFCRTFQAVLVNCVVFGSFISAYICLTSIILVDLLGLDRLTNAYGILSLFRGVASLIGPPIAGLIYDATGSYTLIFVISGMFMVLSAGMSFMIPQEDQDQVDGEVQEQIEEDETTGDGDGNV